jgi:hypothetical protein
MAEIRTVTTLCRKREEIRRTLIAYEEKSSQAKADLAPVAQWAQRENGPHPRLADAFLPAPGAVSVLSRVDTIARSDVLTPRKTTLTPFALAFGTLALGALAVGALAVGYIAIGQLRVKSARINRLEVGELVIGRIRRSRRENTSLN